MAVMPSLAGLWNRALAELVVYGLLYGAVFRFHTSRTVQVYNQKFRKSTSYHLPVHIATGLFEITRYQVRVARHGEAAVAPGGGDVVVCLIWAWTSLCLVRSLQRGDPATTRPAYQAGIVLRPLCSLAGFALQSPSLYRVCAKAINSFVYARVGIWLVHKSAFLRGQPDSAVYSLCIPVSAILSIHEGRVLGAVPVYVAVMFAIRHLNHWVSTYLGERRNLSAADIAQQQFKDWFAHMMLGLGFAELDDVRQKRRNRMSLSSDIIDEYIRRQDDGCRSASLASIESDFSDKLHRPWDLYEGPAAAADDRPLPAVPEAEAR
ncbi:hypothetical protein CDD83_3452 [Cordyceps sp. RAO-2017]|nr:hypothetical protein CDD83_3452 [Cordyceps sp. RAO-2017]